MIYAECGEEKESSWDEINKKENVLIFFNYNIGNMIFPIIH